MKLVDKYKLNRKITKLEKLYVEATSDIELGPSTRRTRSNKVTANIFSKKLADVKAAVEAGQDVNQTNDKGLTPLALACKSKVILSDIVEYLLDHGANTNDVVDNKRKPAIFAVLDKGDLKSVVSLVEHGADLNAHYKGTPIIEYALRYCEIKDTNVLIMLIPDDLSFFDRFRTLRYLTGNRSTVSGNVDSLISKLTDVDASDRSDFVHFIFLNGDGLNDNNQIVIEDLRYGNGVVFDKFVSYGCLPFVGSKQSVIDSYSKAALNKVYNAIKLARDGKLDYGYLNTLRLFLEMCDKVCIALNVPSIMYDLINVDFINNSSKDIVASAIEFLLGNNKIEKIKELSKGNLKRNDYAAQVTIACIVYESRFNINQARTAAGCRLLNKFMTRPIELLTIHIKNIQETRDTVLLDYLFECGMGDILTARKYASYLSNEFIEACKEYGFEIKSGVNKQNEDDYKAHIADIVIAIEEDTWNRVLEKIVTENPRILFSDEVQAALNDSRNSSSFTRRQLLRKIEQLPSDVADAYDM